jgi:hypothetical protein
MFSSCLEMNDLFHNLPQGNTMKKQNQLKPLPYPQTVESAHQYFIIHGINRSEWCRAMGLKVQTVTDILRGKGKGTWGEAHKTAVLLGIKPNPDAPHKTAA